MKDGKKMFSCQTCTCKCLKLLCMQGLIPKHCDVKEEIVRGNKKEKFCLFKTIKQGEKIEKITVLNVSVF